MSEKILNREKFVAVKKNISFIFLYCNYIFLFQTTFNVKYSLFLMIFSTLVAEQLKFEQFQLQSKMVLKLSLQ